jgi:hypothetical protein
LYFQNTYNLPHHVKTAWIEGLQRQSSSSSSTKSSIQQAAVNNDNKDVGGYENNESSHNYGKFLLN